MEQPTTDDVTQDIIPQPNRDTPPNTKKMKRAKLNSLIGIFAIIIAGGFLQGVLPENPDFSFIELLTTVLATIMALYWCYTDAAERNFTISLVLSLNLLLIFPLGFLYYILRTRNNFDSLKVIGVGILIFISLLFLNEISYRLGCVIYDSCLS